MERLPKCHSYKIDIFCFLYFILKIENMNIILIKFRRIHRYLFWTKLSPKAWVYINSQTI